MQKELFQNLTFQLNKREVGNFSADNFCEQKVRCKLENKYIKITEITDKFNRRSVSYQLSKKDSIHSWLKYKEGFSAELVNSLLDEFNIREGDTVLDPFLGSGTTSLVASLRGINNIGFDILPLSHISISAKSAIYNYNISELCDLLEDLENLETPKDIDERLNSIGITEDAYPKTTEKELVYYTEYFNNSEYSSITKNLITLCILNSLEKISYSAKDGQYLRWDYRCPKIIKAEEKRLAQGKKPFVTKLNKGILPSLKETLIEELSNVIADIQNIQGGENDSFNSKCDFFNESALWGMPKLSKESIDGIITSPPYCNRYDYTRTYALELSYLGIGEMGIRNLRQELLSCTVESKTKIEKLKEYYVSLDREADFYKINSIITSNQTLNEINKALKQRCENGDINNKGILQMVKGYFTELAFIFAELYRLCKKGAHVAFVNDNVRYAGEVIPVDFISTELAEQLGFTPIKIYTLKQQKGNSSQQMKKFGRVPLRKSITIWRKD